MRTTLVFPPSLCLPNQVYHALPLLGGALRAAGRSWRGVDLNVESAHLLCSEERIERLLHRARELSGRVASVTPPGGTDAFAVLEAKLLASPAALALVRDPVHGFDQSRYRDAFWCLVDTLGFLYQRDPIVSPFRPELGTDIERLLQEDAWTPMRDLWEEGLLDELLAGEPEFVGVTLAFPEQTLEAFRLARLVRSRSPGTHLCLGGPLLNVHPERWLADGWLLRYFDSAVLGEGDRSIVELLDALEGRGSLESVTNLVWRDARGSLVRNDPEPVLEDMDALLLPDFRGIDLGRYFNPRPVHTLMLSRGCYWGKCTFCSIGWRENYRCLGDERIAAQARDLAQSYGARYVDMADSSVPPRAARVLADVIDHERLGLHWKGGMKFTQHFLDRDYCEGLGRGGCRSLLIGYESANQQVLDRMAKGYRLDQAPEMLLNLRTAGISAELLWFVGFPGESRAEALRTVEWMLEHRSLFGLTAFVGDYQLHPDTEVFEHPERFGVTVIDQDNGYCRYVVASGLQQDELAVLKRLLAVNNNRTLVCSGCHLPHLVEGGLDLSGLERPLQLPVEVVEFCRAGA